jgi:hypothetical protein
MFKFGKIWLFSGPNLGITSFSRYKEIPGAEG